MGWSIDEQRLWIGNGTLADGAPEIGNTEILTQYSDLLSIAESYTYQGASVGYIVQTGPNTSTPIVRTLQSKLDDFVNVKDFGATGNGSTNDLAAINRALYQLYCRFPSSSAARKKLYFPAGTYIISGGVIAVPPYANLVGDGKGRTIFLQTDSTQTSVVQLADSLQQTGTSIGTNGAQPPINIDIQGMSFTTQNDQLIMGITAAQNVSFGRVSFQGPLVNPITPGSGNDCVYIQSFAAINTQNIQFDSCEFEGLGYGITADDDMQSISIVRSYFHSLYEAVVLGQYTTGSPPASQGPLAIRFGNNTFDKIANTALNVYNLTGISSEFNYYGDCGNANLGLGNPIAPVIIFGGKDNYSIGDAFQRNDADNGTYPRVLLNDTLSYYLISHFGVQYGMMRQSPGNIVTLADNTGTPTSTGITLYTAQAYSYIIDYSVVRGTHARTGTILVSMTSAGQTIQDNGLEATTSSGVTFSLSALTSGSLNVNYVTTSTGTAATFIFAVRRLTLTS